jgi:hypothetical protein
MGWHAPEPPDWVRAVNAGTVVPITDEARRPLRRDDLLAEARARTGLTDFGGGGFLEPLTILLRALEDEAELTILGRWMTRRFLLRFLEVRLHLAAYVVADPGVRDEPITEPWFVTGAPRTGTTILHGLLAQDPAHRAPEGWEFLRPVPPPDPASFDHDVRIALADAELRLPALVVNDLDAIHEYSGRMPKECLSAMSFAFQSEEFTARYHVPSYAAWFEQCDMTPAYEMHRLVLQVLQRRFPRRRWVLKSPVHLHSLPVLLSTYPDARIAVTHRDPLTVLASVTSLVATLRAAHSERVDFTAIGADHARRYAASLDHLVTLTEAGVLDPARVFHLQYAGFVTDHVASVQKLYGHFGSELAAGAEAAMVEYLAARPQGLHGAHHYSFADLALDAGAQQAAFARYQSAFAVPVEQR